MAVLLTGGAGYIGSITNWHLHQNGIETVIFDNLSTGHKESVQGTPAEWGDITNPADLDSAFTNHHIDAVIHFAAKTLPGESMLQPAIYYKTNVLGTLELLEAMKRHSCKYIVFSSSCSVFGHPKELPVTENAPYAPVSVYAETKMMGEMLLKRYDALFGIHSFALRYFNASGALLDGSLGEYHMPENHIIPNLFYTALGKKEHFDLYGTNYDTPDGTCVRDYIHVLDLAQAHQNALDFLRKENRSEDANLGAGVGYSNKQIIAAAEKIADKTIPICELPRRMGDPDAIFANPEKANRLLGWHATYSSLDILLQSAWKWHAAHANGFE